MKNPKPLWKKPGNFTWWWYPAPGADNPAYRVSKIYGDDGLSHAYYMALFPEEGGTVDLGKNVNAEHAKMFCEDHFLRNFNNG